MTKLEVALISGIGFTILAFATMVVSGISAVWAADPDIFWGPMTATSAILGMVGVLWTFAAIVAVNVL